MVQRGDGNSVLPAGPVRLSVRHGEVPQSPPADLGAFCRPVEADNDVVGWRLTDDSIAFGDHGVIGRFAEWRSSWVQAWVIGTTDMLAILADTAVGERDRLSARQRGVVTMLCSTDHVVDGQTFSPADLDALEAALQIVRHALHARGGVGFGVVDATPCSQRVGMLRSWVWRTGGTILGSAGGVTVRVDRGGLGLSFDDGRPALEGINSVELTGESTRVETASVAAVLAAREARVLGWLIPESVRWRVRPVPEVVVWANTFAAVSDASRLASALDREAVLHIDPLQTASTEPS